MDEFEPMSNAALAEVRRWIDRARKIAVLTGAGISTDSGIPDFRGPQGLWTKNPEAEKAATLQNYVSEPAVRKAAWKHRVEAPFWRSEPNTGHAALVELERRGKLHGLITQNVDGLHQAAGNSKAVVIEIHGTVHEVVCLGCEARAPMERALERVQAGEEDPACKSCGGILKSATISFGQSLVHRDLVRSQQVAETCDLMLAVGSTLGVYPIANVVPVAKQSGARVVIVNGSPTEMDDLADAVLRGSISEILPQIVA